MIKRSSKSSLLLLFLLTSVFKISQATDSTKQDYVKAVLTLHDVSNRYNGTCFRDLKNVLELIMLEDESSIQSESKFYDFIKNSLNFLKFLLKIPSNWLITSLKKFLNFFFKFPHFPLKFPLNFLKFSLKF